MNKLYKPIPKIILLLICAIVLNTGAYSQNWEKSINKIDIFFNVGDYKKAGVSTNQDDDAPKFSLNEDF